MVSYDQTMTPLIHSTLDLSNTIDVSDWQCTINVRSWGTPHQRQRIKSKGNPRESWILGCVPLGWSVSGSVIRDHSDHARSNEPMNPLWTRIHRIIWSTMIQMISEHWSWSGSYQRNGPLDSTLWITDFRYWISNSFLPAELGFRIPIISMIPDSWSWIPHSKAQDSGFCKKKVPGFCNPDYLTWGERASLNLTTSDIMSIDNVYCIASW